MQYVFPHAAGTCTEGEVRLVGGETNLEGQVQICLEGGWGTVCTTTYWNDKATAVVCRQLGFSPYGNDCYTTPSMLYIVQYKNIKGIACYGVA